MKCAGLEQTLPYRLNELWTLMVVVIIIIKKVVSASVTASHAIL